MAGGAYRVVGWLLPAGVVVAVMAAAAWPLLAAGQPLVLVAIGAAGSVVVAFGPWLVEETRRVLAAARRAHRRAAGLMAADPHASAAWLLYPGSEVVDFFGRTDQLSQLTAWCRQERAVPVCMVTAPGGYGKTRLARRLAGLVRRWRGWRVWPVEVGQEGEAATLVGKPRRRWLLVVDYAESRPAAGLAQLVAAVGKQRRVRLLLLARAAGPWWSQLAAFAGQPSAYLDSLTSATRVVRLPARADQRPPAEIVADAAAQFADHLGLPVPAGLPSREWEADAPLFRLHAEALVAVLGGSTSHDQDVIDEVLGHEARYWRYQARRRRLSLPADELGELMLRQTVAVASLLGAEDAGQVADLIRRVPAHQHTDEQERVAWGAWLADLYPVPARHQVGGRPRGGLGTLQPDMLAEYLAAALLTDCTPAQLTTLVTGLKPAQAAQALTVLGRAVAHHADLTGLIPAVLATDCVTMARAVFQVAPQLPGLYSTHLANLLATTNLSSEVLEKLADQVPAQSMELNQVALALTTRLVDTAHLPSQRANWLSNHAVRLVQAGRRAEALTASEEAVKLRRELATSDRDAYLPNLAMSVNNHALLLTEAGRRGEALTVSEEAVGLYRELAATNRDAYLRALAASVSNHACGWRTSAGGPRP